MNQNLNLTLDINQLKKLLPVLRVLQPYLFGLALIGVFGYTAYLVNGALNIKPAEAPAVTATTPGAATAPKARITFDKTVIETVKSLQVVEGGVETGKLGTDDPFR